MHDNQQPEYAQRRSLAIRLLSVLLIIFVIILGSFVLFPGLLANSLFDGSVLTVGMLLAFLFIVFIIFISYIYAYAGGAR